MPETPPPPGPQPGDIPCTMPGCDQLMRWKVPGYVLLCPVCDYPPTRKATP